MEGEMDSVPPDGPQKQSAFFRVPTEVRAQIYQLVFSSLKIRFTSRKLPGLRQVTAGRSRTRLPLLYVCRDMTADLGSDWIRSASWHFDCATIMMSHLFDLPASTLSQFRRIVIHEVPWLGYANLDRQVSYSLAHLLKMLPGLRLDSLTVLSNASTSHHPNYSRSILDDLLRCSNGWKELRFISPVSRVGVNQGSTPVTTHNGWTQVPIAEILVRRDGVNADSAMTWYWVNRASAESLLNAPPEGTMLGKRLFEKESKEAWKVSGTQDDQYLIVVARRAGTAIYQETTDSPHMEYDVRGWMTGLSWASLGFVFRTCHSQSDYRFE